MTGTNRDVDLNLPDTNLPGNANRPVVQAQRNELRRNQTIHRVYR